MKKELEERLCEHIFSVSAAMVGVCLTVIGLMRIFIAYRHEDTFADDIVAVDAMLFLIACLSSYWALRAKHERRLHRLERFADTVFIVAMLVMVAGCIFMTYAIAIT